MNQERLADTIADFEGNLTDLGAEVLVTDVKTEKPLKIVSICVDTEGCACKGLGMVLKSNVGIEYGIGVTFDRLGRITEQTAEALN